MAATRVIENERFEAEDWGRQQWILDATRTDVPDGSDGEVLIAEFAEAMRRLVDPEPQDPDPEAQATPREYDFPTEPVDAVEDDTAPFA